MGVQKVTLYQSRQYKDKSIYIRRCVQPLNGSLPYGLLPSYYFIKKAYPFNIVTLDKEELKGLYFKLSKDDWFDAPSEGGQLNMPQRRFFYDVPSTWIEHFTASETVKVYFYSIKRWLFIRLFNPTQRRLLAFTHKNYPRI